MDSLLYLMLFFLLSIFHLSATHSFSSMQPLCHDDERSALLQFKESFLISMTASSDPSAYPKVSSWKLQGGNGDCCTWDGVECSEDAGHVIGLDLSSSCLYGSINSSNTLFRLIHLERLNLAFNDFNQSKLPSELGQLSGLTYLNLSYSAFSGQIPSEILRLSDMTSLDLSYNSGLELKKPNLRSLVQHLTSLEILHLSDVSISSTVPNILANLSSLKSLDLSWCGLLGEFPTGVFQLPHLQMLDLSHNENLTGHLPEFHWSNPLKSLILYNTGFSGVLPISIGNLASLTVLDIDGANFSGSIPSSLGNLSQLTSLDLSYNYGLELKKPNLRSLVQHLRSLEILDLSDVSISSTVPDILANLSSLKSLRLRSCGLHGEFPTGVFQLPHLQFLDLYSNENLTGHLPEFNRSNPLKLLELANTGFSGELPFSIGNLASLTVLKIYNANFSGSIPSSLGNLSQLTTLDLSSNKFWSQNTSSLCWLVKLTKLTRLNLEGIDLNGEIPSFFANLTQLAFLRLRGNGLTGQIPFSLVNLNQLETLLLSYNQLTGQIPSWLTNLPKLSSLHLHFNHLTGQIPSSLMNLTQLIFLGLDNNQLVGHIPSQLMNLTQLTFLGLSSNKLQGSIPSSIFELQSLQYLNLSSNKLSGTVELDKFAKLKSLDLSSNALEGSLPIPPASINLYLASNNKFTGKMSSLICNLSSLQVLNLSFNRLSGRLPRCLGNFSDSLLMLNLRSNNFQGSIPEIHMTGMMLRMIDLNDNQLQGQLPRSLTNCPKLQFLDFGHNQIDDIFPSWLGTLPELGVLILRSNKFHGVIGKSESTFEFSKLRIIDFSHNHFTGKLPSGFSQYWTGMKDVHLGYMNEIAQVELQFPTIIIYFIGFDYSLKLNNKGVETVYQKVLKALTVIDFSSNQLEGKIPEYIGDLKGLHALNLSNNFFTGHIPSELANMSALEVLDLSQNKLSGEIPQQLTQLTFLGVLDVSHNLLTGRIPRGKQFDTFQNNSFEENSGLCGFQLSMKCENLETPPLPSSTFEKDQDSRSLIDFDWIIVLLGFCSGLVVGVVVGNSFTTWKHEWFVRTFGRGQRRRW